MNPSNKSEPTIAIAMALHNAENTLEHAISSFLAQKNMTAKKLLVIANDSSTDKSKMLLSRYQQHPEIVILDVNFRKVYQVRNYLNDYIRKNVSNCLCIGRLDADDYLASEEVLAEVEKNYRKGCEVLLGANLQLKDNVLSGFINRPTTKLLEDTYLLSRLERMAEGDFSAELPSCNVFIAPHIKIKYPNIQSAEDHWFTVQILIQKKELSIRIAPNLIYAVYSISGTLTKENRKIDLYLKSRKDLLTFFKSNK